MLKNKTITAIGELIINLPEFLFKRLIFKNTGSSFLLVGNFPSVSYLSDKEGKPISPDISGYFFKIPVGSSHEILSGKHFYYNGSVKIKEPKLYIVGGDTGELTIQADYDKPGWIPANYYDE